MSDVAKRIINGDLPRSLEDADWRRYVGRSSRLSRGPTSIDEIHWKHFCLMWSDVTWVRYQVFERDADDEAAAEDYDV